MSGIRRLWTGPYGAAVRDRALAEGPIEPSGLWLVPCPLAREQVTRLLGLRQPSICGLRVWCWDDLWRAVRQGVRKGPWRLSEAGARAALIEAIARARRAGGLGEVGEVADLPGFRRRLRARIAAWTRAERRPGPQPPRDADAEGAAQWAAFRAYRGVLGELGAEDADGMAVWASRVLEREPPSGLHPLGPVTVIEPNLARPSIRRAVGALADRAAATLVTLAYDPDPALAEAFGGLAPAREQLIEQGYVETVFPPDPARPECLRTLERDLLRDDVHLSPRPRRADGLTVLGAPVGEGQAALVARRVRALLDQGAAPEEVVVLFPRWDEQAEVILETLRAWGIPAAASRRQPLASEPAVAALRLAMTLPSEDWETTRLVRLLRNGQVRPDWPERTGQPHALATAAAAIRGSRVYRGRDAIRQALDRLADGDAGPSPGSDSTRRARRIEQAKVARRVLDRLIPVIEKPVRSGPWQTQAESLRRLADALGIGTPEEGAAGPEGSGRAALGVLFDALDDQAMVLDGLGRGAAAWSWTQFVREVDHLAHDLTMPAPAPVPGAVRLLTVDEAQAVRAEHLILANLAEGTFPAREAVDPDLAVEPGPEDDGDESTAAASALPPALARELRRFLGVLGSAGSSLTLVHPTTDEKGQKLLPAGFLDDLVRFLDGEALRACSESHARLPSVPPPDLAAAPCEARVRAVALACRQHDLGILVDLARDPEHRAALEGAAAAFRLGFQRFRRGGFGPYDGQLTDPRAIDRLRVDFGPGHPISPSQLESLAFCPFQFAQRYVFKLDPVEELDEIDADRTARGSLIHEALELLHARLGAEPLEDGEPLSERVAREVQDAIVMVLNRLAPPASDIGAGLYEIEIETLRRAGAHYADQFRQYLQKDGAGATPHRVEWQFGDAATVTEQAVVTVGEGDDAITLWGKVDRIDTMETPDGRFFRVIDYKSGHCPSPKELKEGLALQLPLYALAVERTGAAGPEAVPRDFGYWDLTRAGYQKLKIPTAAPGPDGWRAFQAQLESYVLALVARLRAGAFLVAPRKENCMRFCDYRMVCRIGQVRHARKVPPPPPKLGWEAAE